MCKGRIKSNVENTNKEVKVKSSEEEEIKIPKCSRKSHVKNVNEEMEESIGEKEDIGIRKCRRRSQVDIFNKEVKGWKSSSKQQNFPPEPTKTKEGIRLEQMKIKVKITALEWDNSVLQEQFKSLIYVKHSLRGDPIKDKLIDELNPKNYVCLNRKSTSKFFVGITKRIILIFLMQTIHYHIHLFRISNINQTWFRACQDK